MPLAGGLFRRHNARMIRKPPSRDDEVAAPGSQAPDRAHRRVDAVPRGMRGILIGSGLAVGAAAVLAALARVLIDWWR